MAQNDMVIANAAGATVRADINSALQAVITLSSGTSAPTTTVAGQLWWDTTNNLLKIRNGANTAWVDVADWDGVTWDPTGTAIQLVSTDPGAAFGPALDLFRDSPSPAAADILGSIFFKGNDSAAAAKVYAQIIGEILDPTSPGSQDGALRFHCRAADTGALRMRIAQGITIGDATVLDKGVGALNVQDGYFIDDFAFPRRYIDGFQLVNNVTDAAHDVDIGSGFCTDVDHFGPIYLVTGITKRIDASWAVGTNQGGLDGSESVAGTPDANTWYHLWAIKRSDTGVVDVLFSESATAPTMPTNYNRKRRIGAVLTDGSANILGFVQAGDDFLWKSPILDVNASITTTASLHALSVPDGIKALVRLTLASPGTALVYLSSPDQTDEAPQAAIAPHHMLQTTINPIAWMIGRTDTSRQIRLRASVTATVTVVTHGWTDLRGRS